MSLACNQDEMERDLCSLLTLVNTWNGRPRYSKSVIQSLTPLDYIKNISSLPLFMTTSDSVCSSIRLVMDDRHKISTTLDIEEIFLILLMIL